MLMAEASKSNEQEKIMDGHAFLDAVKRFRMIAKQQEEQLYRKSEYGDGLSEIENVHAKRDMYSRELWLYNKDRSF